MIAIRFSTTPLHVVYTYAGFNLNNQDQQLMREMQRWGVDQIDEETMREISNRPVQHLFGVRLIETQRP